jgi:uncharacterized protein (DUF697 family)
MNAFWIAAFGFAGGWIAAHVVQHSLLTWNKAQNEKDLAAKDEEIARLRAQNAMWVGRGGPQ